MARSKQPPTKMKESDDDRSDDSKENEFENDMDEQHPDTNNTASTPSPSKPDPTTPTKIRTLQVTTRSSKTINQPITHNQELQQDWAEHTETQDVVIKVATGNKHRIVKQTEILPEGKQTSTNDYDICMHVYSRENKMGICFVPTLYKTDFIDKRRLSKGMVPFRRYDSSAHPIHQEALREAEDYLRADNIESIVPINKLAKVYGTSYRQWNTFLDRIEKSTQRIQELGTEIHLLKTDQDLMKIMCIQ
jgi:hypothetical protein